MLKPALQELIPLLEELDVAGITEKCQQANLPKDLVKEISRDAHWPAVGKKNVELGGAEVAAKWLNKIGISSTNKGEVFLIAGLAGIYGSRRMLTARLDKLIAQRAEKEKEAKK
jgi:hypothetical protein